MFRDTSDGFIGDLEHANKEALLEVGEVMKQIMITKMRNTPRDPTKTYYNTKGKAVHHPSQEYNPPAIWSGEFKDSLEVDWNDAREVSFTWTNVPYALELEYGRASHPPMAARGVWYVSIIEGGANTDAFARTYFNIMKGELSDYG